MISEVCVNFHCFIFIIWIHTVASIDTECYTEPNGTDYRGVVNVTSDGITCQSWNSRMLPHYYRGLGDRNHNYCRNPDRDVIGVWCYTNATDYEHCNIGDPQSSCDRGDTTSMPLSSTFTSTTEDSTRTKSLRVGLVVGVLIPLFAILIIAGICIVYRKRQTQQASQSGLQYDGPYELGSNISSIKTPGKPIGGKANVSDTQDIAVVYTEIPENTRSEPKSSDNGWKDNSVYASADNDQEGWKDNEIYASED